MRLPTSVFPIPQHMPTTQALYKEVHMNSLSFCSMNDHSCEQEQEITILKHVQKLPKGKMDPFTMARSMLPLNIDNMEKQVPLQNFVKKPCLVSGLHPFRMKRKHAPQQTALKMLSNI
mmetsp:Transcript_11250/g.19545  ORF Transcript_11250/g.19545 Transcript_11250/m.19545 type:complete len:118 (-) Transcript_11250:435-788(-)